MSGGWRKVNIFAYVFLWDGWLNEDKPMNSNTFNNAYHAVEDHRNGIDESEKRIQIYVCGTLRIIVRHKYILCLIKINCAENDSADASTYT